MDDQLTTLCKISQEVSLNMVPLDKQRTITILVCHKINKIQIQ